MILHRLVSPRDGCDVKNPNPNSSLKYSCIDIRYVSQTYIFMNRQHIHSAIYFGSGLSITVHRKQGIGKLTRQFADCSTILISQAPANQFLVLTSKIGFNNQVLIGDCIDNLKFFLILLLSTYHE